MDLRKENSIFINTIQEGLETQDQIFVHDKILGRGSPPLEFVVSGSMGTVLLGQRKENTAHEKYLLMKEEWAAISFALLHFFK